MLGEFLGSVGGDLFAEGDRARQRRAMREALASISGVNAEAGPSAYEDIRSDPALRNAQMAALSRLQTEGAEGGLGLQSRVALNEAAANVARRERGAREAILQNMAMRGNRGGGAELAANLANQQGGYEANAMSGARAAADARARALAATMQSGQLAGGVRGQDFGEAAQRAQAQDALSRFNASQRLTKGGMMSGVQQNQAGLYGQEAERWKKRGAGLGAGADLLFGAM